MAIRIFRLLLAILILTMSPALAENQADRLAQVLRISEVMAIMRDEGVRYGQDLDADMLGGEGGAYFKQRIAEIHDPAAMEAVMRRSLAQDMQADEIAASIRFFDTELGQRILALENAGRVALSDPQVDDIARSAYEGLKGSDDARLAAVSRFVRTNDLIERNVASALASNYQFYRGLQAGSDGHRGFDIMSEVWAQEPAVREDTEAWVYGFLLMAYRPLQADELDAYIAFSGSPAGQALNTALFNGFERMYRSISYQLGLAVARALAARDI
ncbi:DUF2059 domain-containing protein [Sedimentitalea sp. HM32M-2]|uniref:DUF2059 domain-containing protein n=1 Tax=Sedimentitalea sp. HM32M-2 TaxID=3351566 RepID=UPI00362CF710